MPLHTTTLSPSFKLLHLDTSFTLSIVYGGDTTCVGPILFEAAVCPPLCTLPPAHHVLLESEGKDKDGHTHALCSPSRHLLMKVVRDN